MVYSRIFGPQRIAIVGAGELGFQAMHYLHIDIQKHAKSEIVGWFDDTKRKGTIIKDYRVLGGINDILNLYEDSKFDTMFIAIGYNHFAFKNELIDRFSSKIPLINVVSPNVYIDSTAKIGCNIMFYPGSIVDKEAVISDGAVLNLGTIVSHNSVIGKCSFLAPGTTVAGFTNIGDCCFMGVNSTIIDNLNICDNVKIGAGSVVTNDINHAGLYLGVPAKKISK